MSADTAQEETPQTQAKAAQQQLAATYPGWTIWRSNTGRWYATRHTQITKAEGRAGCNRMVDGATPEELTECLDDQEARALKAVTP